MSRPIDTHLSPLNPASISQAVSPSRAEEAVNSAANTILQAQPRSNSPALLNSRVSNAFNFDLSRPRLRGWSGPVKNFFDMIKNLFTGQGMHEDVLQQRMQAYVAQNKAQSFLTFALIGPRALHAEFASMAKANIPNCSTKKANSLASTMVKVLEKAVEQSHLRSSNGITQIDDFLCYIAKLHIDQKIDLKNLHPATPLDESESISHSTTSSTLGDPTPRISALFSGNQDRAELDDSSILAATVSEIATSAATPSESRPREIDREKFHTELQDSGLSIELRFKLLQELNLFQKEEVFAHLSTAPFESFSEDAKGFAYMQTIERSPLSLSNIKARIEAYVKEKGMTAEDVENVSASELGLQQSDLQAGGRIDNDPFIHHLIATYLNDPLTERSLAEMIDGVETNRNPTARLQLLAPLAYFDAMRQETDLLPPEQIERFKLWAFAAFFPMRDDNGEALIDAMDEAVKVTDSLDQQFALKFATMAPPRSEESLNSYLQSGLDRLHEKQAELAAAKKPQRAAIKQSIIDEKANLQLMAYKYFCRFLPTTV